MNPLHLIWIIPLSGSIGFLAAALLTAASNDDWKEDR